MFIDASALGELTSQLTSQDLESLVGFNIQPADLEALQEATEGHVSVIVCRGKLSYFLCFWCVDGSSRGEWWASGVLR